MSQRVVKGAAIGIDLGTTYSCVGIWIDAQNRVEIIPNEQGNKITPSFIAFNDTELFVGEGAKNQIGMNPTNTVFDVKRLIGSSFNEPQVQKDMKLWPFKIIEGPFGKPNVVVSFMGEKKKSFAAEELSGMVLKKMKDAAENFIGIKVTDAVITVPAYFNNRQREATMEAANLAGLNVLRLLNEPTAAAIAYGVNSCKTEDKEKNVLVFDLGGGTFDVSLLKVGITGVIDVKAVGGDTHLGGEDFDMALVKHCINDFWKTHNKNIRHNHRALARLKVACEKAKRDLSSTTLTSIDIDCLYMGIDFSTKISRAKFEELNLPLFNKCIELVGKCLIDGKMHKKEVDEVVVVGGSSRIPKVQKILEDFFDGKSLCKSMNGDEAVAFGAAILAAKLSENSDDIDNEAKEKKDVVLQDVTPLSLGIEVRNVIYHMNVGIQVQNPPTLMDIIIPRNTCIPTSITKGYHSMFKTVCISVYQGESINVHNNILLGHFFLYDITLGRDGISQIEVCFSIDVNGILQVTAEEISTGKRKSITIDKTISHYNSLANPNLGIPKVKKERV